MNISKLSNIRSSKNSQPQSEKYKFSKNKKQKAKKPPVLSGVEVKPNSEIVVVSESIR